MLKGRVLERHTRLSLSQIMVPPSKTHELWERYHKTSGHIGVVKMEALLRRSFYWQGITTDLCELFPTEEESRGKGTFGVYSDIIPVGNCFD